MSLVIALLNKIQADYDHPWPNEDDGTKRHRLLVFNEITKFLENPVSSIEQALQQKTKEYEEIFAVAAGLQRILSAVSQENEILRQRLTK